MIFDEGILSIGTKVAVRCQRWFHARRAGSKRGQTPGGCHIFVFCKCLLQMFFATVLQMRWKCLAFFFCVALRTAAAAGVIQQCSTRGIMALIVSIAPRRI